MASEKAICKPIAVKVAIKPGSTSPAQKQAWCKFWQKLIVTVKASER